MNITNDNEKVKEKLKTKDVGGEIPPTDDEKTADVGGEIPPDDDEQ